MKKCSKHPKYKAIRPPKNWDTNKVCAQCWSIYAQKHPANATAITYCGVGK